MIWESRSSVLPKSQESREAFCCISSALVATPPALAALPGASATSASVKTLTASGVAGMLAPSATIVQPFFTILAARSSSISFWVAAGIAMSHATSQTEPWSENSAESRCSAYSGIRPRCTSLISLSRSSSMPSSSVTKPLESEQATTVPPSSCTFSMA